jgi:uncharacterized membrane-anchored protein
MKNKGIYFALAAAVISGFAVFLNKFAGKAFGDSGVFTTWKNIPVAIVSFFFAAALILFYKFKQPLSFPTREAHIRESSSICPSGQNNLATF